MPPAQKPKPTPPAREGGSARKSGQPALAIRIVVTIFLVWHITGLFLAGLSVPGPTSPLVRYIAQHPKSPMHWYLNAFYLNQGHSFFAPDVGCGYLITSECFDANGQSIERGELPSRKENWPRLLYHRYFMLASQAGYDDENKQVRDESQRAYLKAYGAHLLHANKDAQVVRLRRYAHWPLPIEYARSDRKRGYETLVNQLARRGESKQIDGQGYEFLAEATVPRSEIEPRQQTMYQNNYWQSGPTNTANRWTGSYR